MFLTLIGLIVVSRVCGHGSKVIQFGRGNLAFVVLFQVTTSISSRFFLDNIMAN